MQQAERIAVCSTCKNRGFSKSSGIVCGLTDREPDFDLECKLYKAEEKIKTVHVPGTQLGVQTADKVVKQSIRVINFFVDTILIGTLAWLFLILANIQNWYYVFEINRSLFFVIFMFLYYTVFEYTLLQTPGKLISRTKVVNKYNERPKLVHIMGRTILRLIPFEGLTFLNQEANGWHDRFSETKVVSIKFKNAVSNTEIIDDHFEKDL